MSEVSEPEECSACGSGIRWFVSVKGVRICIETKSVMVIVEGRGEIAYVKSWIPHSTNCTPQLRGEIPGGIDSDRTPPGWPYG